MSVGPSRPRTPLPKRLRAAARQLHGQADPGPRDRKLARLADLVEEMTHEDRVWIQRAVLDAFTPTFPLVLPAPHFDALTAAGFDMTNARRQGDNLKRITEITHRGETIWMDEAGDFRPEDFDR